MDKSRFISLPILEISEKINLDSQVTINVTTMWWLDNRVAKRREKDRSKR